MISAWSSSWAACFRWSALDDHLGHAVRQGNLAAQDVAFRQIPLLQTITAELAVWVRKRLSAEVIVANNGPELLKLEALSARLPTSVGSSYVLMRSRKFQRILRPLRWVFGRALLNRDDVSLVSSVEASLGSLSPASLWNRSVQLASTFLPIQLFIFMNYVAFGALTVGIVTLYRESQPGAGVAITLLGVVLMLFALRVTYLLLFRSVGRPVDLRYVLQCLVSGLKYVKTKVSLRGLALLTSTSLLVLLFLLVPGGVVYLLGLIFGWIQAGWGEFAATAFITLFAMGLLVPAAVLVLARRQQQRMRAIAIHPPGPLAPVLYADSIRELATWIDSDPATLLPSESHLRSCGRVLLCPRSHHPAEILDTPLYKHPWEPGSRFLRRVTDQLSREMKKRRVKMAPGVEPPTGL